jgi:hypothetical protein
VNGQQEHAERLAWLEERWPGITEEITAIAASGDLPDARTAARLARILRI